MESPDRVNDSASCATIFPTWRMTSNSDLPAAQEAFSHSRICATVMTGIDMRKLYVICVVKKGRKCVCRHHCRPGQMLANCPGRKYVPAMTTTVEAIYENGKLVLPQPLSLPENSRVRVTIESADAEREAWLKLSEETLKKTWDNNDDDVFNELLSK
jgi:predicted DNA-binding antitoxin AbrB/MazE fold protein